MFLSCTGDWKGLVSIMTLVSILLFIFSIFLLVLAGALITGMYARDLKDAFWIMAGALYLQISSIPLFLSIFTCLNIKGFLFCQIFLTSLLFVFTRHKTDYQFVSTKKLNFTGTETILLILAVILISIHFIRRIYMPLFIGDVLYYHASRPLYWIQNLSMAAYPTMNDRQTVFAFGSDLIFMWPVLFTRSELIGRMIYWIGFPAAATGFYTVMREMHCSKKLSLLGVNIFLSIPIVFFYGITLEPLIWVTFFALGAGYWAMRVTRRSDTHWLSVFWLGIYCVLVGNMKNNGIALIPAGAVVLYLAVLYQTKGVGPIEIFIKYLKTYGFAVFTGLILSGLGFLLVQNIMLHGNPLSSGGRLNENIADFSLYQIYVHTIRVFSVLAEIPVPFVSESFMVSVNQIVNWLINLLGADRPLPKEMDYIWIGHYRYSMPRWPGYNNFGIAGLYLFLFFMIVLLSTAKKIVKKEKTSLWQAMVTSDRFSFAIISLSLLLMTTYILRWINSGTRSFIAPGVVCVLAWALSFLNHKYVSKRACHIVWMGFILFCLTFTFHQTRLLIGWVGAIGSDWSRISYTQKRPHRLIEEYVPESATLILLVHTNFKDYTAFGEHYTRHVIQVTTSLDKGKITRISNEFPEFYIYVDRLRFRDVNESVLQQNPNIYLVAKNTEAKLFKSSYLIPIK